MVQLPEFKHDKAHHQGAQNLTGQRLHQDFKHKTSQESHGQSRIQFDLRSVLGRLGWQRSPAQQGRNQTASHTHYQTQYIRLQEERARQLIQLTGHIHKLPQQQSKAAHQPGSKADTDKQK
ncbi:hypothetical protein EP01_09100 [Bdellovibrio bacteriovorus]|nr:hypothetical protein EP01_09100 [Bdellovibrio bacteriovorus]